MVKKFQKMAEELISTLGFIKAGTDGIYPWSIETKAGALHLAIMDDWIACVFVDQVKARGVLKGDQRLNIHSGKWNWMSGESDLQAFASEIKRLLIV